VQVWYTISKSNNNELYNSIINKAKKKKKYGNVISEIHFHEHATSTNFFFIKFKNITTLKKKLE